MRNISGTAYDLPHDALAARMFCRWCQKNFFRYMMRHYAIDLIAEYGVDDFPDTEMVVNRTRRELTKKRNTINGKLKNRQARFTALNLSPKPEKDVRKHNQWEKKKLILLDKPFKTTELLARVKTEIEIRVLRGILPICASCKNIRDDKGFWEQIEMYISKHSDTVFSYHDGFIGQAQVYLVWRLSTLSIKRDHPED